MPPEMFGDVILTGHVPERELRAGDVGTVLERHVVPDGREEWFQLAKVRLTMSRHARRGFVG